ncbi:type II toxin-antitoxin system VapB family antitoxin [Candidatus Binatia bacterium]|nr:type II toxin-antitoxin system VapB family antitoxin [Candidatus Binatia bacterium]
MRITLDLEPRRIAQARRLSGITDVSELIQTALEQMVHRAPARRLAALGDTEPLSRRRLPRRRRARCGP